MLVHNCEKNITEQEILIIEDRLNTAFPEDFKAHYLKWNGGSPDKAVFKNPKTDEDDIEISHFIGMKYNRAFRNDPDFTLEGRVAEEWENLEVPEYLIPYALDWYGNYVCLHKSNGKIYYYIRDVWNDRLNAAANFSNNSVLIAESFADFLSRLTGEADDGQIIQDEDTPPDCADTVKLAFRDCEKNITEQEIGKRFGNQNRISQEVVGSVEPFAPYVTDVVINFPVAPMQADIVAAPIERVRDEP